MGLLSNEEINSALVSLDGWVYLDNQISKSVSFDTYLNGIEFVNSLAKIAEEMNHHPDLKVGWCQVEVLFTSHDLGGVTTQCIEMAKMVDSIL
jgi:4a-hydroxytetrahydrobiopterin dehydratase|tara:strand:+ start:1282 stop:1560 length:279 start_codon:yes stop_codon:yes gene_type:complete